jgi:hypothetical protein
MGELPLATTRDEKAVSLFESKREFGGIAGKLPSSGRKGSTPAMLERYLEMAAAFPELRIGKRFGQRRKPPKMFRNAL